MTDVGKWHFEKQYTWYNYTLFIWEIYFWPEEMNDINRKMIHTRMMDRGFTAFTHFSNSFLSRLYTNKNLENIKSSKCNTRYV